MKVNEIFTSLQGEGKNQGYPCTFIRLSGCNLACSWCDTPGSREFSGSDASPDEVLHAVENAGNHRVCITGGEPLLQTESLLPLLRILKEKGFDVEIETNGTVPIQPVLPYATVCMDIKCPSSGMESDLSLLADIRRTDTVKFVVADRTDCEFAHETMESQIIRGEIFLSPVWGSDIHETAIYLASKRLPARLQVQLHKIIGFR